MALRISVYGHHTVFCSGTLIHPRFVEWQMPEVTDDECQTQLLATKARVLLVSLSVAVTMFNVRQRRQCNSIEARPARPSLVSREWFMLATDSRLVYHRYTSTSSNDKILFLYFLIILFLSVTFAVLSLHPPPPPTLSAIQEISSSLCVCLGLELARLIFALYAFVCMSKTQNLLQQVLVITH